MSDFEDRYLGMNRPITRRDFMNGAAMVIGSAMLPTAPAFGVANPLEPQNDPGHDPPVTTGLRGSHPGSFEIAHSLRDGTFWGSAGKPVESRNWTSG
jgi:spermidine dehydrogenase